MVRTDGNPSVASLTTGDTTAASLAIDDSCVASRIIGDSAPVSVGSARAASARIDCAGVVSVGPSVSMPKPKGKKGRGGREAKKGWGSGKAATTNSASASTSTLTQTPSSVLHSPVRTAVRAGRTAKIWFGLCHTLVVRGWQNGKEGI
jgi:hypothetical protein